MNNHNEIYEELKKDFTDEHADKLAVFLVVEIERSADRIVEEYNEKQRRNQYIKTFRKQ